MIAVCLLLTGAKAQEKKMIGEIDAGAQCAQKLNRTVALKLDYLLYLPKDYSQGDKKWPLIVFLHGSGERGSDLNKVKAHGPPKLVEQGKDMPFIIVSPQCPRGKWWPSRVETIMALIDEIAEKYDVDQSRIYLTGLSMGGYGTWSVACAHPERFAAIVPICGGGMTFIVHNLKDMPVWAFHGAKDPAVPLKESQRMVNAVNVSGGEAKLTVYPNAGHDSWTRTYDDPELYKWLLKHKR